MRPSLAGPANPNHKATADFSPFALRNLPTIENLSKKYNGVRLVEIMKNETIPSHLDISNDPINEDDQNPNLLPVELFFLIARYLDATTILNLSCCCKKLYLFGKDEYLWRNVVLRDYAFQIQRSANEIPSEMKQSTRKFVVSRF